MNVSIFAAIFLSILIQTKLFSSLSTIHSVVVTINTLANLRPSVVMHHLAERYVFISSIFHWSLFSLGRSYCCSTNGSCTWYTYREGTVKSNKNQTQTSILQKKFVGSFCFLFCILRNIIGNKQKNDKMSKEKPTNERIINLSFSCIAKYPT